MTEPAACPQERARVLLAIAVGLLGLVSIPAYCQGPLSGSVRIELSVNPGIVPADGKSRARIRIEVRDRADQPMPDGTPILCTTDTGLLQAPTETQQQSLTVTSTGGYATVYCTSRTVGTAKVTVRVRDSRQQVFVQFVPKGEAARAYARVLEINAGWIGYCVDLNVIRAREGVRVRFGQLAFEGADKLEVDVRRGALTGWGGKITIRDETMNVQDYYYELGAHRGVLRHFGEYGVERVYFTPFGFSDKKQSWEPPQDAFRADDRSGATWLVCNSCMYFLGQKVVVKHATLYAGVQKVFDLPPYWVVGMPGYTGTANTQVLGMSTDGGLAVDLPFFYRVTDEWAGSVKIQHGASGTSLLARSGWSLALEEEYQTLDSRGSIEASGLLSSGWGIEWQDQRQVFGGDQAYFNVAWPDHRSLFADSSIYHYADDYRLNLRAEYDDPISAGKRRRIVGDWLTDLRPLGDHADYRLGTSLGVRRYDGLDDDWVLENELYFDVQLQPWKIGATKIRPSITNSYLWETNEYSTNRIRAELRMSQQLDSSARLGLNYYLTYRSGDTSMPGASNMLGLNYTKTHGRLWNLYFDGTWDANEGDKYAYLGIDYHFKPAWRLGIIGTYYDYEDVQYDDLELQLGRMIGNREVALRYVVDSQRLSLELGGFGFR